MGDGRPYGGMTDRIVGELTAASMVERTLVTSFQLERLRDFHGALERQGLRAAQLIGIMLLCSPQVVNQCGLGGIVAMLRDSGVSEIGLKLDAIDEESLKYLRNGGFKVHGWAAHTIEAAQAAFALELASFTTDCPDLALLAKTNVSVPCPIDGSETRDGWGKPRQAGPVGGGIFGLGLQLPAEKPDALGARFRQHWRMWRKREPNGNMLR